MSRKLDQACALVLRNGGPTTLLPSSDDDATFTSGSPSTACVVVLPRLCLKLLKSEGFVPVMGGGD